jgi:hypothetical protein
MFITLTIDVNRNKNFKPQMKQVGISSKNVWRKAINKKKRNMWLRTRDFLKSLKRGQYRLTKIGSQVGMF